MKRIKKVPALFQRAIARINQTPLCALLFFLLLFYLPFQCRYHRPLKHLYRESFSQLSRIPFNFDKALYFYVTDFLMIALIITFFLTERRSFKKVFFEGSAKYLTLFISLSLISVLTSPSHGHFWVYYRWTQLLIPMLVFYAIKQTFNLSRFLLGAFWVLFAVSCFESAFACIQYMAQSPLGFKGLGEGAVNGSCSAFFPMPDKTRWLLDRFFHTGAPFEKILRATGTLPHPNILGGFLGLTLFSNYYLYLVSKKTALRILIAVTLFLQLFALCLTFSRAALIGSFLCTLLWLGLFMIRRKWVEFSQIGRLALILFFAASCSFILLYPQFLQRGGVINYNGLAATSDSDRVIYQNISFQMLKQHPIQGVGFNHFHLKMDEMNAHGQTPLVSQIVHNIYLLIVSEMGIVAFLAFIAFIASLIVRGYQRGLNSCSITLITAFLFLLWLGLCDHYLITNQHGRIMLFVTAGLLANFSAQKNDQNGETQHINTRQNSYCQ